MSKSPERAVPEHAWTLGWAYRGAVSKMLFMFKPPFSGSYGAERPLRPWTGGENSRSPRRVKSESEEFSRRS